MDPIREPETGLKLNPKKKQKKPYQKPKVTTFGSVAELTHGSGGSHADFVGTRHGHPHHHNHHH